MAADSHRVGRILKRRREPVGHDVAHAAAVAGRVGVARILHSQGVERLASLDAGEQRVHKRLFLLHGLAGRLEEDHDVAHIHLLLHPLILGGEDAVLDSLVHHIGGRQVAAVCVKLLFKRRGLVKPHVLGRRHLLAVGDEELEILLDVLRRRLLRVVFVIKIFKFAESDRLSSDCHQHGICRALGLGHDGGPQEN